MIISKALGIKELWRGKDLYRMLMNAECVNYELHGTVLDVGSGVNLASYHRFFKKAADVKIISLDIAGDVSGEAHHARIDLEHDVLPYADASIDSVIAFNILEHIYDHAFLISEIKRVLRPGGRVIGAVPFLVGYHPDPHDYWRYTSESLRRIFVERGFRDIHIEAFGYGPFAAGYAQIELLLPRILKIFILPCVLFLDRVFLAARPGFDRQKFALGSFFSLRS